MRHAGLLDLPAWDIDRASDAYHQQMAELSAAESFDEFDDLDDLDPLLSDTYLRDCEPLTDPVEDPWGWNDDEE